MSKMPSIFFSSDFHLDHYNIIKYCNRPFSTVKEMNDTIIGNLNKVVSAYDTLYVLGDFCFGQQSLFREQINCNSIILVKGNHDKQCDRSLFTTVKDMTEYNGQGVNIVLCHYAMRSWNKKHHGSYHLFGHGHCNSYDDPLSLSFDCGVDGHNFKPWSLDEVVKRMTKKLEYIKYRKIYYVV